MNQHRRVVRRQQAEEDELKKMMEDKRKQRVYSKEELRRKENMDIELFKLFIRRRSYCYTNSHTCIYHMHTTSVHPYHQLWVVAL